MKWKYETDEQKEKRLAQWRKWFAWYPVRIDGQAHWLEFVERRDYVWLKARLDCPNIWNTEFRSIQ